MEGRLLREPDYADRRALYHDRPRFWAANWRLARLAEDFRRRSAIRWLSRRAQETRIFSRAYRKEANTYPPL